MTRSWYKEGVVYQIYPQSFKDSNDDGIGDLNGITSKIDYLKNLGVNIVWLSPIYASPMDDNGYDISDYCAINPIYGTMNDFDRMLEAFHKAGIKLIMDLVVNHTSDEHYWFKEACRGKDNPYHDYYFFKEGKDGKFPNNWTSFFGGDAWKFVPTCNEYYLHLFSPKQPDLNWDNPKVREEIKKILRFWLDKGVDGFRCDVINLISKTSGLPNGKKRLFLVGNEYYANGPHVHDYLKELRDDVFSKYDCFTVGECGMVSPKQALEYISNDVNELSMLFQFDHMNTDNYINKWFIRKFKPVRLKRALSQWQYALRDDGWNTLYFENHDQPRSVSRFGSELYRIPSSKMLATFLFLQKGTPYIYQGEEIGMTNANFTNLDDYKDVETLNVYKLGKQMFHFSHKRMMKKIMYVSRDNARTPMQWDDSKNGGFSQNNPWLKINPNYLTINVKKDMQSSDSIFEYYKKLIALRKKYPVLNYGHYLEYMANNNKVVCYQRYGIDKDIFVVCNYSGKQRKIKLPFKADEYEVILNNYDEKLSNEEVDRFLEYQCKVFLHKE